MNNKIYIVTSGECSLYEIEAVFTTKEIAEDYVQQHGTDYRVEEYYIDQEVEKKTKLLEIRFSLEDDSLVEARAFDGCTNDFRDERKDTCQVCKPLIGLIVLFFVDTDSMDRAIKVARERFAAIKANEYIWQRLTTPISSFLSNEYEIFNIKTNEFTKE